MFKKGVISSVFLILILLFPLPGIFSPLAQDQDFTDTLIENIEIRGARRVPQETVKHYMLSQKNTKLDPTVLRRDFKTIWAQGFFDDVKIELEQGKSGTIVIVWVHEKSLIREIKYQGLKSLTQTEILDKFKEKKVGLGLETPFDPTKVQRAVTILTEMLAEKGRQYAEVKADFADAPANGKIITFLISEGPKVKVQKIEFHGNTVLSDKELRKSMKHIKQKGFIATFTGKATYDRQKLEYCLYANENSVTAMYHQKGYIKLVVDEPKVDIRDVSGTSMFPLPFKSWKGKRVFVDVKLDEGGQYKVGDVNFTGNTRFTKEQLLRVFGMQTGDVFNGELIRKGFDNLKKIYGALGYINWTPIPRQDIDDETKVVNVVFDFDEGKPYLLRTLEFAGNTTTRDKVLRREVLVYEGGIYNTQLWDISLLRLNQLGFFDKLKTEDAEVKPDARPDAERPEFGNVDVTLKVKEKGKNSIGFTGGVSGYGGTFLGISYSTNNFMGFGENLDVILQGGTRQSAYVLSFTEPYFKDRPLTTGFSVFHRRYSYHEGDTYGYYYAGQVPLGNELFSRNSTGFTLFGSYPIKPFTRFGLTYSLDKTKSVFENAQTAAFYNAFQYRDFFTGVGSNDPILTSKLTPMLSYNTVDNPMEPSRGKSLTLAMEFTGGPIGGQVKFVKPFVQASWFRPMNKRRNTLGMHATFAYVSGYGGLQSPFWDRFYTGGEDSIRGFDLRMVSPLAQINQRRMVDRIKRDPWGNPVLDPATGLQVYEKVETFNSYVYPMGGDTEAIYNIEYRIPIVGPVTVAPFFDIGGVWNWNKSQLVISPAAFPGLVKLENGKFVDYPRGEPLELIPNTSKLRASTGVEIQVIMPVVNAPFRLIFAYNPLRVDESFYFPWNPSNPFFQWRERAHDIKFTVGRTF
jgi:outer membrane protein insertion porin family